MSDTSHIFISGSYRTGTALLRRTLNSSDSIAICGETHYFKHRHFTNKGVRDDLKKVGDIRTDDGVDRIVEYLFSGKPGNFWRWVAKNMDREEFRRRLLASARDDSSVFRTVMEVYGNGAPILGEKTPAHIYHVPTLLEWFPAAKVLHTFRDPRAIFVSNRKKRAREEPAHKSIEVLRKASTTFEFYLMVNIMLTWRRIYRLHEKYSARYPDRYYLSKYERLISDPESHLRELSAFLGIDFDPSMLNQELRNSSYIPNREEVRGFDTSALTRWKSEVSPFVDKWFLFWCGTQLRQLGYDV